MTTSRPLTKEEIAEGRAMLERRPHDPVTHTSAARLFATLAAVERERDEAQSANGPLCVSNVELRGALAAERENVARLREALAKCELNGRKFNSPWSREIARIAGLALLADAATAPDAEPTQEEKP